MDSSENAHDNGRQPKMEHEAADDSVVNLGDPMLSTDINDNARSQADKKCGKKTTRTDIDLIYSIEDVPPWYLCFLLGFQHYLTMFGATIALPLILAPNLCITDALHTSEIISTIFFVSGMVTILQVIFGVRLPIVQGSTYTFLIPAFAILSLPQWKCPESPGNGTDSNVTNTTDMPPDDSEIWTSRMCELQGAIIIASLFQVIIGVSGLIGLVLRFIGPIVIAPTIALIGISLFESASRFCSSNWWVAIMTMVFIIAFSQYLRNISIPCCGYSKGQGCTRTDFAMFKLFPVILAILTSWAICGILTATDAIPDDDKHWAYGARTDTKSDVLQKAKWFRFPYPGQWGLPTVSTAGVFGMLSGVVAGMIESIGDYYACARLSGAPPPPVHAINRGILVEGLGCVMAGLWGTGTGTTSYSENIGAIGITKVGSRRVLIYGGGLMIVLGMLGKFGALFVTIPDPIIGGVFMVMFGMITAVGISNLQFVDMNSSRNLFIFGFSLFFGLSLPQWLKENVAAISTGNEVVDQIFQVLLSTNTFVGGALALILDNTIPGTDEERGIKVWRQHLKESEDLDSREKDESSQCYDLPVGMSHIRKWKWTQYVPLCPTFTGLCHSCFSKPEVEKANEALPEEMITYKTDQAPQNGEDSNIHHRKSNSSVSSEDPVTKM